MKTGLNLRIRENLKALGFAHTLANIDNMLRNAKENGSDYEEFLLALTDEELQIRDENRLKRKLRDARFPLLKTLEMLDYEAVPELDRRLVRELETGAYIGIRRNVIFVGKSGAGKTHLATALGVCACRQGVSVRFVTGCGLANELIEARSSKTLGSVIQKYAKCGLLIIDELGYVPFSRESSELLFQIFAERHERGSVIITTNLGFADWTKVFGEPALTAALLDRVTHRAHIFNCNWESYRLKDTLKNRKKIKEEEVN